jgi:hypothetical protein
LADLIAELVVADHRRRTADQHKGNVQDRGS